MLLAPHEPTRWSERLAFDIALRLEGSGEEVDEILSRYELDLITFNKISKDPVFLDKVGKYRDEIKEKGVTFRLKARTQAEELLKTSWILIHSPDVSPAVKADLIKSTVKWAGLEPKGDFDVGGGVGGVKITINLGNQELGQATFVDSSAENASQELDYESEPPD